MIRFTRTLLSSLLILGALAGLGRLHPRWLAAVGLDFEDVPATVSWYSEQLEREKRLDAARQDDLGRIHDKQQVVQDVIGRRLRLAEAAARFQELDRASPTFDWERFRAMTPGASDAEKECWAVTGYVKNMLANDPGRARAETRRLEAELLEVLRHGGPRQGGSPLAAGRSAPAPSSP